MVRWTRNKVVVALFAGLLITITLAVFAYRYWTSFAPVRWKDDPALRYTMAPDVCKRAIKEQWTRSYALGVLGKPSYEFGEKIEYQMYRPPGGFGWSQWSLVLIFNVNTQRVVDAYVRK